MRAGGVPARCGVRAALAASHILVLSPALGGKRLSQVWQATRVKALLRVSRLLWEVAGAWNGSEGPEWHIENYFCKGIEIVGKKEYADIRDMY